MGVAGQMWMLQLRVDNLDIHFIVSFRQKCIHITANYIVITCYNVLT